MSTFVSALKIGTASASAVHAADLGKIIVQEGKTYRMCKATGAVATAGARVLKTALTLGVPTWYVDFPTAAVIDNLHVVVPSGQTGSTGTTGLVAGDYFYAQVSGPGNFKAGDTAVLITAGMPLQVLTSGYVVAYTASPATGAINQWPSSLCRVTNSAIATAAGDVIPGMIAGLI